MDGPTPFVPQVMLCECENRGEVDSNELELILDVGTKSRLLFGGTLLGVSGNIRLALTLRGDPWWPDMAGLIGGVGGLTLSDPDSWWA